MHQFYQFYALKMFPEYSKKDLFDDSLLEIKAT